MANVLDLRRRIRSVKNTRQITKAMKMVSAAKLRRAQERAMQARPYAQMLTNVLESLVRRTDLYNEQTGEIMHPLLVEREEKNVLVIVIAGDKGFAGGFNSNIGKAAQRFIDERRAHGQNIDLEPIGKKAIGLLQEALSCGATTSRRKSTTTTICPRTIETIRHRAAPIEVAAEHHGSAAEVEFDDVAEMARSIIERYERAEIDAVYIVYNEFKSVISQRVVVEKLLPIRKLGSQEITAAEEMTEEQQRSGGASGADCGHLRSTSRKRPQIEQEAKKFGTAEVDYIFDQSPEQSVPPPDAALRDDADLSRAAGVGCGRARRAHDGDGCGDQERRRLDRLADAAP